MLTTDDLFLGGLALARGAALVRVEVLGVNGRRMAVFGFAGEAAEQAFRDYYAGTTTPVDVQLLKLQVRRLKERAFEALRQDLRQEERNDVVEAGGGPHPRAGGLHRRHRR